LAAFLYELALPVKNAGRISGVKLLDDFADNAGADGAASFADGEAKLLLHGDGRDQVHLD
jgi:hypothetical protein